MTLNISDLNTSIKKWKLVKPEKKTVPKMPKENKETNISQELTHKKP